MSASDPIHEQSQVLTEQLHNLRVLTLRHSIIAVIVAYLPFHVFISSTWTHRYAAPMWMTAFFLWVSGGIAYALIPTKQREALVIWLVGLAAGISWMVKAVEIPEVAFLFILMPFLAANIMGRNSEFWVTAGISALVIIETEGFKLLPAYYAVLIPMMSLIMALWGRTMASHYYEALYWSNVYVVRTQSVVNEVRVRRAQLRQLVKDLDQAYAAAQRAHSARLTAFRAVEEAQQFKTELVTNISHELRTPLNLIIGFVDVMMTAPENYGADLPGAYRRDLSAVYNSAQHLLQLVDDVLDLARIDAQKLALVRERVNVASLINEVLDMMAQYVTAKGLNLYAELDDTLPDLWVDRLRIRQVLLNLIGNSIRFTEKGWIRIRVTVRGGELLIQVQDTGCGVAPGDVDKIFEEFRTTAESGKNWYKGTGLGLPISKKFIELHDGQIGVDTDYTQGTSIWFTLPLQYTTQGRAVLSASRDKPSTALLPDSRGLVILIHDDDHVMHLVKRNLSDFEVIRAASLDEAVMFAEQLQATAILVGDTIDPARINGIPQTVIRCPLPANYSRAEALGVEDILVKPISHYELLTALDRIGCKPERVLILDDDPAVGQLIRRILRMRVPAGGFVDAYTGTEGLQLMRTEKPDLVLLDLSLPDITGFDVLARMSQDPALANIPVIIVSANQYDLENTPLQGDIVVSSGMPLKLGELILTVESVLKTVTL